MLTFSEYKKQYMPGEYRSEKVIPAYGDYFKENIQVGDGVTVHLWSDAYACTVIKKTANTLTLRRDKAILDPDFKPEFVPGGFGGFCMNNTQQTYSYEPDPEASIYKAYWRPSQHRYVVNKSMLVTYGRREFFDYNF